MQSYTKDTLLDVLKILKDGTSKSATKAVLIERIKAIICDGEVPAKPCPPGSVLNKKTGRCNKIKVAKAKK